MTPDAIDLVGPTASPRGDGGAGGEAVRPAGRVGRMTLGVAAVGVVITLVVTATAWTLDRRTERRLLDVQTRQAGAVLSGSILSISDPLATALQVAQSTGGDTNQFDRYMATEVGAGHPFVSASLWRTGAPGTGLRRVGAIGVPPLLVASAPRTQSFLGLARHSPTFVVTAIPTGGTERIGYAEADRADPAFVVYAERAIPADRQVAAESSPAFADLNFATYLGPVDPADLATTDLPGSRLPLGAGAARVTIPFGDSTLTLVAEARGHLGGALGADLPWIFLVGGLVLSAATAGATRQLVGRRREAEAAAVTISGLYGELDGLYREQRGIAETLQRTLLPLTHPDLADLDVASLYIAGADGVEIGGDWYSVVAVGDHHFAFTVGDVSGKGVAAASVMARLRYTLRAYLVEGHPPETVLRMCSEQIDLTADGHFATALVGVGDLRSGLVTLANAGHLNPLLVAGPEAGYVATDVGVPLGVGTGPYRPTSVVIPPGGLFLAFTDGLVERRGESIETGLARLAQAATAAGPDLDDFLVRLVGELDHTGAHDDTAVLVLRRRGPAGAAPALAAAPGRGSAVAPTPATGSPVPD